MLVGQLEYSGNMPDLAGSGQYSAESLESVVHGEHLLSSPNTGWGILPGILKYVGKELSGGRQS